MRFKIILSVTILYIIILFLQYTFTKTDSKNFIYSDIDNQLNTKIMFNNKNKDLIKKKFTSIIEERINLLNSGKLKYDDWIAYNIKNNLITIQGNKYYIFIFDQLDENSQIITKVHGNANFINLSWNDVIKSISENLIFTKYSTDPQLINNMFMLSKNGANDIEYYWNDPLTNIPIKKHSFFNNFHDDKSGNRGVIGIGFDTEDLNITTAYKYVNIIHFFYVGICSALTFFITILIIFTSDKEPTSFTYAKAIAFFIFTNIYLFIFLNTTELTSTSQNESDKIKGIRDGILSTSFLTGVNTFILTSFSRIQKKNNSLFFQTALLFGTGIFLLLLSTIKYTNYTNVVGLIQDRISLQLTFNFCILINMLILFNYTMYYLFNKIHFHKYIYK